MGPTVPTRRAGVDGAGRRLAMVLAIAADLVLLRRPGPGGCQPGDARNAAQQLAYSVGKVVQFTLPVAVLRLGRPAAQLRPGRPRFRAWPSAWASACSSSAVMFGALLRLAARLAGFARPRGQGARKSAGVRPGDPGALPRAGGGSWSSCTRCWKSITGAGSSSAACGRCCRCGGRRPVQPGLHGPPRHRAERLFPGTIPDGGAAFFAGGGGRRRGLGVAVPADGLVYSPWLSHLLIDAAIFVIGYDMLLRSAGVINRRRPLRAACGSTSLRRPSLASAARADEARLFQQRPGPSFFLGWYSSSGRRSAGSL